LNDLVEIQGKNFLIIMLGNFEFFLFVTVKAIVH